MAQTKIQYLLGRLAEEAVEIAKDALKAQAFGVDDRITFDPTVINTDPAVPTNIERLVDELNDLMGLAWMLEGEGVLPADWQDTVKQIGKMDKVERYMGYAQLKGELEPDIPKPSLYT